MEGSVKDLSIYRLERALEDLATAEDNLSNGRFRASVNRSYYAIFHAARAVLALDGLDFKKHAGVVGTFSKEKLK